MVYKIIGSTSTFHQTGKNTVRVILLFNWILHHTTTIITPSSSKSHKHPKFIKIFCLDLPFESMRKATVTFLDSGVMSTEPQTKRTFSSVQVDFLGLDTPWLDFMMLKHLIKWSVWLRKAF